MISKYKWISYSLLLLLIGCNQKQDDNKIEKPLPAANFRIPTATEVFHLRNECAKMGEKILSETLIGIDLSKSQVSKYDPKSNRCYVELFIASTNNSLPTDKFYTNSILYDGQTGEMLAFATDKSGKQTFGSFKVRKNSYRDTLDYIGEVMNDEDYTPKK